MRLPAPTRRAADEGPPEGGLLPGASAARGAADEGDETCWVGRAALRAADAQKDAAAARVGQVREDANRALRALEGELVSLQRKAAQSQTLADQAAANYDIYAEQQRAGHGWDAPLGVGEDREIVVGCNTNCRLGLRVSHKSDVWLQAGSIPRKI